MAKALNKVNFNEVAATPQTQKAAKGQKRNNAGGFSFKVDDKDRFRRFLTIGTDGGTYYVGENKLTEDSVKFVQKYIKKAGVLAVNEIVEVSDNALAPKNDQALFALAIAFGSEDLKVKAAAKEALPKVARTATHLFQFAQFIENTSGWGRAKTSAVAAWYTDKSADQVAFQAVKYRQRNGWTHRDLLRLSHPKGLDEGVVNFILGNDNKVVDNGVTAPEIITAFKLLQAATSEKAVVKLLEQFPSATWEMVPTEFLKSAKVWKTLFYNGRMGQTALLRNTKRMHEIGAFDDVKFAGDYAMALADKQKIEKGRLHPINYLNAYVTYGGDPDPYWSRWNYGRSGITSPNNKVVAALEAGYDAAFKNIVPANKRTLMGLDVSGSMSSYASGLQISCATLGAAFGQTLVKREPYAMIRGFAGSFKDLGIVDSDSIHAVMKKTTSQNFGSTDCALPMKWALKNNLEFDTFVIFTDNETWGGSEHAHQALERYRQKMGIPARLVVVAATATRFSVADPNDAGSMDVSGFDSSAPKLIADFSAGRI